MPKKKIKKKKSYAQKQRTYAAASAITRAGMCLRNEYGFNIFGLKHKALIREYAKAKGLTIPENADLKSWIIEQFSRYKRGRESKKGNRILKPTKKQVANQFAKENTRKMTVAAKKFKTMMGNARIDVKCEYYIPNPTSFYLIDFYIERANLCVEIDGEYHNEPEQLAYDAKRDAYLVEKGYRVVRITNKQMKEFNSVIDLRNYIGV